jgi:hypothetical protein
VPSLSKELTKLRTHNCEDLERQNVPNDEHSEHHNGANLDIQFQETAASLPVEAAPRIKEVDLAGSTKELANDLAAERAVEGDDGVLLVRQDGGLNANLGDDGGDTEEEAGEDGEDEGSEDADGEARPLALGVLLEVGILELVQTEENRDTTGQVQADVGHGGRDGGRRGEGLPVRLAGDALPESGLRGHGDNLVGPCCVNVGNSCAGKTADEDGLARDATGEERKEEAGKEVDGEGEDYGVKSVDLEAPEASETASVCDNVLDGGADARGNRLLANEGDGSSEGETVIAA